MKIDRYVEYTALCEVCHVGDKERTGRVCNTRKQAIAAAKASGWRVVKGKTLCPECVKQFAP